MSGKQRLSRQWTKAAGGCYSPVGWWLQCTDWTKQRTITQKAVAKIASMRAGYIWLVSWHRGTKRHRDVSSAWLPSSSKSNWLQNSLLPIFFEVIFPRVRERILPVKVKNKSPALSPSVGDGVPFLPTGSARDILPLPEHPSGWHCSLSLAQTPLLMAQNDSNEEFQKEEKNNGLCWLLCCHVSEIQAQETHSHRLHELIFMQAPAWANTCIMKIKAPCGRLPKACATRDMH